MRRDPNSTNGNVIRTVRTVWAGSGNVESTVSVTERSLDGLKVWESEFGRTTRSDIYFAGNGVKYITNTAPDGVTTISHWLNGRVQSVTVKESHSPTAPQLSQTTFGYDGFGIRTNSTDARNGATSYTFDDLDRVTAITTPEPEAGQPRQTTLYQYDVLGRVTKVTLPDNTVVENEYYPSGELKKTWGSRTYPVEYTYDAQGRMKTMKTWQDFTGNAGAAITAWNYSGYRGFLTNKTYHGTNGPSYSYTAAGRLYERNWARGVKTTYNTNMFGDTASITYTGDGGITPAVTFTYDRLGRPTNVVDGAGTHALVYDLSGRLLLETNTVGILVGTAVTNRYDGLGLRRTLNFRTAGTNITTGYDYDLASRLTNVTSFGVSAHYGYVSNSPLIGSVTFRRGTSVPLTTTKAYDRLNRLTSIQNQPVADSAVSFQYAYNNANQRVQVNEADGSHWKYEYDTLGQVISGKKYWSDQTPVAGQQFAYSFDDIGNRTSTKAGGDANGGSLRTSSYTPNLLNQYSSRTVPNVADVIGVANANANVTVNGDTTSRKGEYFAGTVGVNNTTGAVYRGVTTMATLGGNAVTTNGNLFFAATNETFTYDADGNLKSDGRWTYTWDGENRLIAIDAISGISTGALRKLAFAYDSIGRRVRKAVQTWNGSSWPITLSNRFVYDGWNLIGELNATNNAVVRSYAWGLDLSGTLRGAGGVGGLLVATGPTTNAMAYDGNGNVQTVCDARSGAVSAQYRYGPFGEVLQTVGASLANPIRFSTKYHDTETDQLYYGLRNYDILKGAWLSRDPLGESYDVNVYSFCRNSAPNNIDYLGAFTINQRYAILSLQELTRENVDSQIFKDAGFPSAIDALRRLVPRVNIKIDPSGVGKGNDALYKPLGNNLLIRNTTPNPVTMFHEMIHAYNDINNTRFQDPPRLDEGTGYAAEHILRVVSQSDNIVRYLKTTQDSCDQVRHVLKTRWQNLWRSYGDPSKFTVSVDGVETQMQASDFENLKAILGVHYKCNMIAQAVNAAVPVRCGCFVVSCAQGGKNANVIPAGVAIHEVFR